MNERYIRRVALGPQLFPLNCPVKLAAGALLEDTKQPRLVAQLKFSGTRSTVTVLTVTLHCQGRADTDLLFHYKALSAAPGQAFGQHTAIVLPEGTTDFQVTVEEVVLKNGTVWNLAQAQAQEQARLDAAALREAQRRQAKQEAAEKAAAVKAAAEEKLAQKRAEAQRKAEQKLAAQEARAASEIGTPAEKTGKGKVLAVAAAVLVIAVIAGVIFVPKLMKGNQPVAADPTPETTVVPTSTPKPTPKPTPTPKPVNADFGETGDITAVYITKDDHGYYPLTHNSFSSYLSDTGTICAWMGKDLEDDVLTYLKNSLSFAWIVGNGMHSGISGDGTPYPQGNGDIPGTVCVLAFEYSDNRCFLTGYFIGLPEQYDEDTIRIDMTMCNYDLTPLYEQERAAFDANRDLLYENYISPDSDFEALGAAYYLQGYYTCDSQQLEDDDVQAYHLWQQVTSADHVDDFAMDIRNLSDRLSHDYSRDRTMFFLLLDKKYQPIGITWQ